MKKMNPPFDLFQLIPLLNSSPPENSIKFLQKCQQWIDDPSQVEFNFTNQNFQFEVDISERINRIIQIKSHYKTKFIKLGFTEQQIDSLFSRYSREIPPFDELHDELLCIPRVTTLMEDDFVGLSPEFPDSNVPQPSQIQKKIVDHIIQLNYPIYGLIVVATGLGKSLLSAFITDNCLTRFPEMQHHVLFLVNSVHIKNQTYDKYMKYFSKFNKLQFLNVDPDQSVRFSNQTFIFCLFQSLHLLPQQLLGNISVLIIDEAHHILAPTYLNTFKNIIELASPKLIIGLTATLTHQEDISGENIKRLFRNQIFALLPWTVAKRLNLFPQMSYFEIQNSSYYLNEIESKNTKSYDFAVKNRSIFHLKKHQYQLGVQQMAQTAATFMSQFHTPRRGIVFMSSVKECDLFISEFTKYTDHVSMLPAHYQVNKPDLTNNIAKFLEYEPEKYNDSLFLVTVGMATEGFDLPDVDCVIFGRQTDSERLFVQQLGRCLRKRRGKSEVFVLDFVANLRQRWVRLLDQGTDQIWTDIEEFWQVTSLE